MYLRKMGSVALLTREGEVEIAKRIEEGENEVLAAILNSPVAVREIIDIGERLQGHKIRVKDIVRDAEDEEHEFDEEEADRRIIRLIERVKRLDKKNQDGVEERKTANDARRKLIDKEASDNQRGAGRDAAGDAPQQEDHRQDRLQAEEHDREGPARTVQGRRAREADRRRPRASSRRCCARPRTIPRPKRPSPKSSASTARSSTRSSRR